MRDWTEQEREEREYLRGIDDELRLRERLQDAPRRIVSAGEIISHCREMQRASRRTAPSRNAGPSLLLDCDFDAVGISDG
jgi:hypothetical protein